MEIKIINSYEEMNELSEEWDDLLTRIDSPQIFYSYSWAACYLDILAPELKQSLCIIICKENGKMIGLFPFYILNGTIGFIPQNTVDYNNVYIDKNYNRYSIINQAIDRLIKERDVRGFSLMNIPASIELYSLETVIRKHNYSSFIEENVVVPYIGSTMDETKWNKKQIKDIERRQRRVENEHELEINCSNVLSKEIIDFIAYHRGKKYSNSTLNNDKYTQFYLELSKRIANNMFINEVYIDKELVAAHMGFIDSQKIYYYIPAYDDKYSSDAVGHIMLLSIIKQNNENQRLIFDFLRGDEDYKFYYTDNLNMNFYLFGYKKDLKAIIVRVLSALKRSKKLRKLFRR